MADVAAPAIEAARTGITMTHHLYNALRGSMRRLRLWTASAALYLTPDGTAPVAEVGALWHNPDLAATYEHIAAHGADDFYTGALGREVVAAARDAVNPATQRGGMMTIEDIAGYKAVRLELLVVLP